MKTAQTKERELIIKLYNEGKTQEMISSILGCSQSKVSFWILRYKKTNNLNNKPRSGRPTPLTTRKLSSLRGIIADKLVKAFLSNFIETLDRKKKYVFILDNASYHKTNVIRN